MDESLQRLKRESHVLWLGKMLRLGLIRFAEPEVRTSSEEMCPNNKPSGPNEGAYCGCCVLRAARRMRRIRHRQTQDALLG